MLTSALATSALIAYHGTHGAQGGGSNPMVLVVFLAAIATGAWVLFSDLQWRNTMLVAGAGWLVVLGLGFAL